MRIVVLMGGWSGERQVSLWSGAQVAGSLARLGHEVESFDLTRENVGDLVAKARNADLVFNALHGPGGEDGVIAGFLEALDVDYTHSGVFASAVAMDKYATRNIAIQLGIRVAEGMLLDSANLDTHPLPLPYIIKPRYEGSTLGVLIVKDGDVPDLSDWNFRGEPLAEAFIDGLELSVGLVDGAAIDVVEIVPTREGLFDFEAKYIDTGTQHIIPARLPAEVYRQALEWSEMLWRELGCRDLARIDYRYDPAKEGEGLYLLEANTHPGLAATSLLPDIARAHQIHFDDLMSRVLHNHPQRSKV